MQIQVQVQDGPNPKQADKSMIQKQKNKCPQ